MRREAAPNPSPPPEAPDMRLMARQLERGCRRLTQSLDAAERAEPEQMVEAYASHLEEAQRLRPALSAAASALRDRSQDGPSASQNGCRELEQRVQGCVELLRQSAEAYGRLIGRASSELAGIDRELRQMQRGSQALRTYRGATR